MALLVAANLRLEHGGTPLFDGVSLTLQPRDRVALSGSNGAGKTTLLRVLAGEVALDGGELSRGKGVAIALHDQRPPAASNQSLDDYVLSGVGHLLEVEATLQSLESEMGTNHSSQLLERYARVQQELESAGGYGWREGPRAYLRSLGFSQADLARPLRSFSGGELTRASLARALGSNPDVLLLDEPTNHLDLDRIEWLEQALPGLDAAIVLVAHDRWFLEATTTSVLELAGGRATYFAGPWHAWRKEKAARESFGARSEEGRQAELARLERFVARFRYGTRARQAQAKIKKIDRLNLDAPAAGAQPPVTRTDFAFPAPARCARTVVEAEDLVLSVGERELLSGAALALERGEKVALVGANGSGKTTLVEALLGMGEPSSGETRIGYGVEFAYFAQHDIELDERLSVIDTLMARSTMGRADARKLLGHFGFTGGEQEKIVPMLSGGERRRLMLCAVVAQGANWLVLDEPTNHLDLDGREALELALAAFPGAVLLVSHDRALLDAVADRVIQIEEQGLRSFRGGWAEFVERRELARAPTPKEPRPEPKKRERRKLGAGSAAAGAARDLRQVEEEVSELEAALARLETQLSDRWDDPELQSAHEATTVRLKELLGRWEALSEQAEEPE